MIDPKIEQLDLRPTARAGAYTLKLAHPLVEFTSGRRTVRDQARAMSQNVVLNRRWIAQTYRDSEVTRALQGWVTQHSEVVLAEQIAAGLLETMLAFGLRAVRSLSKHLSGDAFDVRPVAGEVGAAMKATIHGLRGLQLFLEHEGGLARWHAQFVEMKEPFNGQ